MIDLIDYACLTVIGMLFGSLKDGNFDKFCKAVGREPSPRTQAIYNLAKGRFVNVEPVLDRSEGTANNRRLFFKILIDDITKDTHIVVDLLNNQGLWYVSGVLWIPSRSHPMVLLGEYQAGHLDNIAKSVRGRSFWKYTDLPELLLAIAQVKFLRPILLIVGICAVGTYAFISHNPKIGNREVTNDIARSIESAAIDPKNLTLEKSDDKNITRIKVKNSDGVTDVKHVKAKQTPWKKSIIKQTTISGNVKSDRITGTPSASKPAVETQTEGQKARQKVNDDAQPSAQVENNSTEVKVIQTQTQTPVQTPPIEVKAQSTTTVQAYPKTDQQTAPQLVGPSAPEMPSRNSGI